MYRYPGLLLGERFCRLHLACKLLHRLASYSKNERLSSVHCLWPFTQVRVTNRHSSLHHLTLHKQHQIRLESSHYTVTPTLNLTKVHCPVPRLYIGNSVTKSHLPMTTMCTAINYFTISDPLSTPVQMLQGNGVAKTQKSSHTAAPIQVSL